MQLITLHAREEPTTDSIVLKYMPNQRAMDTVFYSDADLTQRKFRWSHAVRNRPRSRKTVHMNCYEWAIQWHPPLAA